MVFALLWCSANFSISELQFILYNLNGANWSSIWYDIQKYSSYQVILVGDSGVGKSNILQRYVYNTYKKANATIGVEFALKNVALPNGK